ncbi:MAG: DUF2461 domain-containing protein [Acidobacteriota bacterium]
MNATFSGFPPETLQFLRQLKRNNRRDWFLPRKELYDQKVKGPMVQLVEALAPEVLRIAPEMEVDPKRVIYRIYRDTRFSRDKTPYKTWLAGIFGPRKVAKHAGAAFYFHLSPEEFLIAGGAYMPGPRELLAMRGHVATHFRKLQSILHDRQLEKLFGGMDGEQLSRVPKGFSAEHPAGDLLRYKQFLVSVSKEPEFALTSRLFSELLTHFRAMAPLINFLNAPLLSTSKGDPLLD